MSRFLFLVLDANRSLTPPTRSEIVSVLAEKGREGKNRAVYLRIWGMSVKIVRDCRKQMFCWEGHHVERQRCPVSRSDHAVFPSTRRHMVCRWGPRRRRQ